MNRTTTLTLAVAVAVLVGWLATRSSQAPVEPLPKVASPAPSLLDLKLEEALATQTALVKEANDLQLKGKIPNPVAHSAGAKAVAEMEAREEAKPTAPSASDADSIALWFSGNEVGETDPCG